jgi:hypothetical protein
MRAGSVRFFAGTDEDPQRLRRKRGEPRAKGKKTERGKESAFHGWREWMIL